MKRRNRISLSKSKKKKQYLLNGEKEKNFTLNWSFDEPKNEYSAFDDRFLNDYLHKKTVKKSLRKLSKALYSDKSQRVKNNEKKTIECILKEKSKEEEDLYRSRYPLNQSKYIHEKKEKKRPTTSQNYQKWSWNNAIFSEEIQMKNRDEKWLSKDEYVEFLHKKWNDFDKLKPSGIKNRRYFKSQH